MEHRLIVQAEYEAAERDTNGVMLNARGRAARIDPYSLFTHNQTYFKAYASEELVEWRAQHGHVTFTAFEHNMTEEPF